MAKPVRKLDFHSADQAIAEIETLQAQGYQAHGKWSLTQICDHLTKTMRGGMDGFDFRIPWILRVLVTGPMFRRLLRTRHMPSGIPTFQIVKPITPTQEQPEVIETCIQTLKECRDFAGPLPTHPAADWMTVEQWRDIMWIHAAHHLGYLTPQSNG